ncbi:MAG: hypothetical protein LBS57_02240, partial [Treponema sp.]|nr:hypothetical protein [Treponema sp.]
MINLKMVLRSPFSVLRSPFSVLRSPFSVLRSPLGHFRLSFLLPLFFALVFAFTACEDPASPERDDATPPAEVTGLTATAGNAQVTLSWNDPADADLGYIEISWTGGTGGSVIA